MQETFAIRAKRAVQKVAAIGTGLGFVGATLMSAVALDYSLGDYPMPFVKAKQFSNVAAIVGDQSAPDDNTALLDVLSGLKQATAITKAGGAKKVEGGSSKTEDIQIGKSLNNSADGFGTSVDDDDVDGFQDTTVRIDIDDASDDYSVSDSIRFGNACATQANNSLIANSQIEAPILQTGLTFDRDEDWQEKIFITVPKQGICYKYTFDTSLVSGNLITKAKSTDPITINFLGQELEIQNATNTQLVVNSGERFDMKAGDEVQVEGKTVKLESATSSNKVRVCVDTTCEVVREDDEQIINGLEVRAEDVSDDQGIEFDAATLFIGLNARETFKDGEEYIGEDEDNPVWVWMLANLNAAQPTIGLRFDLSLDSPDESDNPAYEHPLYEGESLCLPRDYACVTFDSMVIDDYLKYTINTGVTESLFMNQTQADSNTGSVSKRVLELNAAGDDDVGFQIGTLAQIATSEQSVETDTIFLAVFNSTDGIEGATADDNATLGLFREERDGSDAIFFANISASLTGNNTGGVNSRYFFLDYKDSLVPVLINWTYDAPNVPVGQIIIDLTTDWAFTGNDPVHGPNNGNISIWFSTKNLADPNSIDFLGVADGTEDTYLFYGTNDISSFSENTRTPTGVEIKDPDASRSSDSLEFWLPADISDYKANIVVTTGGRVVGGEDGDVVTDEAPQIQTAGDVTDLTQFNAILGGGPCVNSHVARLKGLSPGSCGAASGFTPNEAIVELIGNGDNVALVVAGWEADDTKRAGVVLKNYDDTKVMEAFKGKTAVTVSGTSMDISSIELS
ncbi:MAG TPA: hypothetical protein VJH20_02620 [Candidatus Nanoarchaeia archaeon]|nr:hypothetical protein [Candidatus Nanoarchaeia archaeon]